MLQKKSYFFLKNPAGIYMIPRSDVAGYVLRFICEDIRHTMYYYVWVKRINWNQEKNTRLINERGVSFEIISRYIENEGVIDIYTRLNKEKYPNQQLFVILIEKYIYLVPFIETEEEFFLKTIFPSRKATQHYLEEDNGKK